MSVPPNDRGTPGPESKVRMCTICKQPRAGHPRSGCPNAIVIPITPSSSSTSAPTIHLQAATIPSSVSTPAQHFNPHFLPRSPSVKPTQAQLNHDEAHWNYTHGVGRPSTSARPNPLSNTLANPGQGDFSQMQWPSNSEWQLMLAGQFDQSTGRWSVVTRDMAGGALANTPAEFSGMPNGQVPTLNAPGDLPFSRGATPLSFGGWQGTTPNPPGMWPTTHVNGPIPAFNTPVGIPNGQPVMPNAPLPPGTTSNIPGAVQVAVPGNARSGSRSKEVAKFLFAAVFGAVMGLYWF